MTTYHAADTECERCSTDHGLERILHKSGHTVVDEERGKEYMKKFEENRYSGLFLS